MVPIETPYLPMPSTTNLLRGLTQLTILALRNGSSHADALPNKIYEDTNFAEVHHIGWCSSQGASNLWSKIGPSDGGGLLCNAIHISSNAPASKDVQNMILYSHHTPQLHNVSSLVLSPAPPTILSGINSVAVLRNFHQRKRCLWGHTATSTTALFNNLPYIALLVLVGKS